MGEQAELQVRSQDAVAKLKHVHEQVSTVS